MHDSTAIAQSPCERRLRAISTGLAGSRGHEAGARPGRTPTAAANAVHILRGLAEARDGAAQPTELEALAARFGVQADG